MFGFLRRKKPASGEDSPAIFDAGSLYPQEVLRQPVDEPTSSDPSALPVRETPQQPQAPESPATEPPQKQTPRPPSAETPLRAPASDAPHPELAEAPQPPDTSAPETTAPESTAPGTTAPGTTAPETPAPGTPQPSPAPAAPPSQSLYPTEMLVRPDLGLGADAQIVVVTVPEAERRSWMNRLRQGMSRTRGNLAGLFSNVQVDETLFEELESALIASDAGVGTTEWLMQRLQERVRRERLADGEQVRQALRSLLVELLMPLEKPVDIDRAEPLVVMIAGVNGAGKTTSIGKLAHHLQRQGKSILLAAGDTFRAAAREQLAEWGSRNRVEVIAQQGGDPAAVAFDAVNAGRARRTGVVMIDTAGRLPTQSHLMDELKKIRRVVAKAMDDAPHETLLVLDGNTGQNMLAQVKAFDEAVPLSGLIVTKLDGTARGGALAALAFTRRERPIPVYFIGVGEKIDDLQAFSAEEFASALLD